MKPASQSSREKQKKTILVADDEASMRELLRMLLESEGYEVLLASDGREALATFEREGGRIDVVVQDVRMPGLDGLSLLAQLKERAPDVPVVIITAFSTWDNAVDAMRLGAFDYVRKPFDTDTIRSVVARALESRLYSALVAEGRLDDARGPVELIGNSRAIQEVLKLVRRVAATDSTILVRGESGTGKEIVARSIHLRSHRRHKPFLPVNCSAFTESLLESELFGHVRGAFTGAFDNKQGLFQAANGGTLFLDEVADMSLTTQVKILRVLEDRRVVPVGSTEQYPVDVRIIAATNKDIEEEVRRKNFREDLYYRLNVIPIELPPLRERKDDIPLLAGHFIAKYSKQMRKGVTRLAPEALRSLYEYDWPGNVRELENVIQREVALCDGDTIRSFALGPGTAQPSRAGNGGPLIPEQGIALEETLERIEREHLREALRRTGGNLMNAAKLLGLSYRSIRYRVKKLGVKENV